MTNVMETYMIDGLHGEIEGHELADGSESSESGTNSDTGEAHFCDWCVNDTLVAILLPETTRDLRKLTNENSHYFLIAISFDFIVTT